MSERVRTKLPFPTNTGGYICATSTYGSATVPVAIGREFEVHGSHCDGEGLVYARIESANPIELNSTISLAMTPEQWAAVFAVVASVAPKPVWSMVEELKR